jgi:hypothetical protein
MFSSKTTTATYMNTATRTTAMISTMKQVCHLLSHNEQYKAKKVDGQKQQRWTEYDHHKNNYESKQRQRRQRRQRQQHLTLSFYFIFVSSLSFLSSDFVVLYCLPRILEDESIESIVGPRNVFILVSYS